MNRVQQLALEKAKCVVPCPEDQLALLNSKKGREERLILDLIYRTIGNIFLRVGQGFCCGQFAFIYRSKEVRDLSDH